MSQQPPRSVVTMATPHFSEGATYRVMKPETVLDEKIIVRCTDGAFQSMWYHARRGLPKSEPGGTISGGQAVEVKGYLLGTVDMVRGIKEVTIKEVVQLPFNPQDAGDAAFFNAKDRAILETKLRAKPKLQMVGNYHSHPNHEIKISDQDAIYFSQYLTEMHHVAVIVGPTESAIGFFLRNPNGEFLPWQEPINCIDFLPDGKPNITETKDEDGTIIIVTGKKVPWRRLALVALLLAVGGVIIGLWINPGDRAVMKAGADSIEIRASDMSSNPEVLFYLDGSNGAFNFIVEDSLPSWLTVEPMTGQLQSNERKYLSFFGDLSGFDVGETAQAQVKVLGYPVDNPTGDPDRANILVTAVADLKVIPIEEDWALPPIRVQDGRFSLDLSSGGPQCDNASVGVRGFRFHRDDWVNSCSESNVGTVLYLDHTTFGSPLEWDTIKLEAVGVCEVRHDDVIMRYVHKGWRSLQKKHQAWKLNTSTLEDGLLKLVTKSLDYPAWFELTKQHTNGAKEQIDIGNLLPNQVKTFHISFEETLKSITMRVGYVGSEAAYELTYEESLGTIQARDLAFDISQGKFGRTYRTDRPDIYESTEMWRFGEFEGPRHFEDIAVVDRWGRLKLSANKQVHHESWSELVEIGNEALLRGDGQVAWLYNADSQTIQLFFVLPEGDHNPRLRWLFTNEAIRSLFKDEIRLGKKILFEKGPIENPKRQAFKGY